MKIVFVGPSLHGVNRASFPGLHFRPPAKSGDVQEAARQGAKTIALIDGIFESGMSVWHRDIKHAIASGAKLYGSSSMGALRAAECAAIGMVGFGKIFNQYLEGTRTRDADVALLFGPEETGYLPLSITQADFEATLEALIHANKIQTTTSHSLRQASNSLFYKHRTLDAIFRNSGLGSCVEVKKLIAKNWINQKQVDAVELLALLRT
jgi:hypothetical protein